MSIDEVDNEVVEPTREGRDLLGATVSRGGDTSGARGANGSLDRSNHRRDVNPGLFLTQRLQARLLSQRHMRN